MTRHPCTAASDRGTTSKTPNLVYDVFLLQLGTTDQSWVELFAMANRSQDATLVLMCTLRDGFRLPLLLRVAVRKSKKHDSFDMSSLVAPPLEQATVVPSEPQARKLSRDSKSTTNFPTPLDRVTDVRIIQKRDNIARGVTNLESLCVRLRVGTVTRALRAQPHRCLRGTTRPFAHHLIRHFDCRCG